MPIERPIFLMGLPRTGTTALHRYLHADPDAAGPGDVADAVPPAAAAAGDLGAGPDLQRHAAGVHRAPRREPRTSWGSTTWMRPPSRSAGGCCGRPASPTPTSRWPTCRATPSGCRQQDWTDAYARHKENLQLVGLNDPEKRWILKNPSHMTALDALMTVYPDALIVYTHRDPVTCIASSCSLSAETTVGHSRDVRRRRDRPHPARPVVAGVPRVPRRAAGVRPGPVRRRRVQGPARRPARR